MVKYIIIFLVLLSFQADGQIIRANPFYTSRTFVAPATDTLLLDSFPTQAYAFSLRKLRTAYTGNAIRVRRSSNNNEQNIGFVNNFLDTASLKTFCSGTNCFVTTWYDQSGSARNATQATQANQPRIYDSATTSITSIGNKISIFADGSNDFLVIGSAGSVLQNVGYAYAFGLSASTTTALGIRTLLSISTESTTAGRFRLTYNAVTANRLTVQGRSSGSGLENITSNTNYSTTNLSLNVAEVKFINAEAYLYENGNLNASSVTYGNADNTSNTASALSRIFITSTTGAFQGYASEIILYNTDQSANRTAIENNINRNWLIY